jgi:hypothetical protein
MVLRTAGEPAILERENLWNLDDGSCVGLLFFFFFFCLGSCSKA